MELMSRAMAELAGRSAKFPLAGAPPMCIPTFLGNVRSHESDLNVKSRLGHSWLPQ